MNGEPIPQPNGGPVRMIVPGWAGIASVKWPVRLEVSSTPFGGYYHAERYIIVDAEQRTLRSVREMPVKSLIAGPGDGETLGPGSHLIYGFRLVGPWPDRTRRGEHRRPADLVASTADSRPGPVRLDALGNELDAAGPGPATIAARATDSAGNVQPVEAAWNKFGYLMNAIVARNVIVQA